MMNLLREPGIYFIINLINKKFYIGSTFNLKKRWENEHRGFLRTNCHPNKHLQRAWNKYGENNFIFEVIMVCSKEKCRFFEQKCLDVYKTWKPDSGYNKSKIASPIYLGKKIGSIHSKQTINKMSQTKKYKMNAVERINPNNGEVKEYESVNAAMRDGFSEANIWKCCILLNKKGEPRLHKGFYWKYLDETKTKKYNGKNKARNIIKTSKSVKRISIKNPLDIKVYNGINEAEKDGFHGPCISRVCKGKQKQHKGYFWQYLK